MDIEIERRADVGVAQYDAHSLVVAVARTNFASEKIVHERQAARTMSTFCFINAASRYHASPIKQRAVYKDEKIVDGNAHYTLKANHRLSAVGMRKSPGNAEAQI